MTRDANAQVVAPRGRLEDALAPAGAQARTLQPLPAWDLASLASGSARCLVEVDMAPTLCSNTQDGAGHIAAGILQH